MKRAMVIVICASLASMALAGTDTSKRPLPRPGSVAEDIGATPAAPASDAATTEKPKRRGILGLSLRPLLRSRKAEREARQREKELRKTAVCDDIAIQGEFVGAVPGKLPGCGVSEAVRVRSVSGVTLSQSSVMDCTTARSLKSWVDLSAKPAFGRSGGGLTKLKVAAHYACRTRNNKKGAKISEHGKGKAIDISAFFLADGTTVTVLKDWKGGKFSKPLRQIHKGACGPFGTVLGPNADRYHQDHFHFDTARYRSGSYCK